MLSLSLLGLKTEIRDIFQWVGSSNLRPGNFRFRLWRRLDLVHRCHKSPVYQCVFQVRGHERRLVAGDEACLTSSPVATTSVSTFPPPLPNLTTLMSVLSSRWVFFVLSALYMLFLYRNIHSNMRYNNTQAYGQQIVNFSQESKP